MHEWDCEEPLVLGLHVCVPPRSGCLGRAEAARAARTPCKEKTGEKFRKCVRGDNVVDFFSFVGLQHEEVSSGRLLDITAQQHNRSL